MGSIETSQPHKICTSFNLKLNIPTRIDLDKLPKIICFLMESTDYKCSMRSQIKEDQICWKSTLYCKPFLLEYWRRSINPRNVRVGFIKAAQIKPDLCAWLDRFGWTDLKLHQPPLHGCITCGIVIFCKLFRVKAYLMISRLLHSPQESSHYYYPTGDYMLPLSPHPEETRRLGETHTPWRKKKISSYTKYISLDFIRPHIQYID